ncbi:MULTISPECIES: MerR family transcriptional regulator [unclassified Saccharibacter]|uniref:MerR family transcriptional regulator n=1 Tax=unclassified Saccharibacter TaxID=2648722 RepID=UPI001EF0866F|nr:MULTISPECIES: MerR family transcriptional regulator [unclassified Saccharibacter]
MTMHIGAASRETGVSIKMIRYYEEIGLIAPTHRTESGYRSYRETDLQQLRFIRHARALGFSVPHIRSLLELWQKKRDNAHVRHVANAHIAQLRDQMTALESMLTTLQALVDDCATNEERADCPILSALDHAQTPPHS